MPLRAPQMQTRKEVYAKRKLSAARVGITQCIGWHTFRHYSSLLRANRTDIKVTPELLRHASKPGHVGYVYPSSDASKAKSPEQCQSSSAGVDCSCWLKNALPVPSPCLRKRAWSGPKSRRPREVGADSRLHQIVLCAYNNSRPSCKFLKRLASPTGFEPALPP